MTAPGSPPEMDHSGSDGMMSQAEMDLLAGASEAAFDTAFLELMIVHHEGAVAEAEHEVAGGANEQAQRFASEIVSGPTAESDQMRRLLC